MRSIVVIPAYNEERTVADVVRRVREEIPDVIVVDDGSTDATAERARSAGATVLSHCVNRGLGAALGTGIAAALRLPSSLRGAERSGATKQSRDGDGGCDIIVTLDADGQHDPAEIPALVAPIVRGEAGVVIGVRSRGRAPLHRRAFHATANLVTRVLFDVRCSDTQSGFRAFSRRAAEQIDIRTNRMEVSSEIIAEVARLELRLVEVPIRAIYTPYSLAKGQSFTVGLKTAWSLVLRRWFP